MGFLPSTPVIYEGAYAVLDGYESSLFKCADCLAGNPPTDVVFLHEIHLAREHLSGLDCPANNPSHELLKNVPVQSLASASSHPTIVAT
jgi:hypothetical protein